MLWHTQHGATAEKYKATLQERGVKRIPDYLVPPKALPGIEPWFLAFWDLSTERRYSGAPIPWSAIQSYTVAPDEADIFRRCIRDADAAYLAFLAQPPEDRQSLPPMVPKAKT